jgi:hypothetical protein
MGFLDLDCGQHANVSFEISYIQLAAPRLLLVPDSDRVVILRNSSRGAHPRTTGRVRDGRVHTQIGSIVVVPRTGRWLWQLCRVGMAQPPLVLVKLLLVSYRRMEYGNKAAHSDPGIHCSDSENPRPSSYYCPEPEVLRNDCCYQDVQTCKLL